MSRISSLSTIMSHLDRDIYHQTLRNTNGHQYTMTNHPHAKLWSTPFFRISTRLFEHIQTAYLLWETPTRQP